MVARDVATGFVGMRANRRPAGQRPLTSSVIQTAAVCNLCAALILMLSLLAFFLFA